MPDLCIFNLIRMRNVLAFSDDRKLLNEIKGILSQEDFNVAFCPVDKFLGQRLRSSHYNLVLLDLDVPDTDTIDMIHTVFEISPATRIIVLFTDYEKDKLSEYLQVGVRDILAKPLHPQLVIERVESVLAKVS